MNLKKVICLTLLAFNLNNVHSESLTSICDRYHIDKNSVLKILRANAVIQKDIKDVDAFYPTVTSGGLKPVVIIETFGEKVFFIWTAGTWDDNYNNYTARSIEPSKSKVVEDKYRYHAPWIKK